MKDSEGPGTALHFHVSYRLGEYLGLVSSHVIAGVTRRKAGQGKKVGWLDRFILRATLYLFAPPVFLFKVIKIGPCDFRFDDAGITRRSKLGDIAVPWNEIVAIHEYPMGYLFAKDNGALPVPLRVLTEGQLRQMKHYVARHRQALGQADR